MPNARPYAQMRTACKKRDPEQVAYALILNEVAKMKAASPDDVTGEVPPGQEEYSPPPWMVAMVKDLLNLKKAKMQFGEDKLTDAAAAVTAPYSKEEETLKGFLT